MPRRSPVRHTVRKHKRMGKWVRSFYRGHGVSRSKPSKNVITQLKNNKATYYHVTESENVQKILQSGLKLSPRESAYGAAGIFLLGNNKYTDDFLHWEDFENPVILEVNLPIEYEENMFEDEAGSELYPDACPVYLTKAVPAKYIKPVGVRRIR